MGNYLLHQTRYKRKKVCLGIPVASFHHWSPGRVFPLSFSLLLFLFFSFPFFFNVPEQISPIESSCLLTTTDLINKSLCICTCPSLPCVMLQTSQAGALTSLTALLQCYTNIKTSLYCICLAGSEFSLYEKYHMKYCALDFEHLCGA